MDPLIARRKQRIGLMPSSKILVIAILIFSVTACATDSPHRKTVTGAGAGAAIGAIIGAVVGGEDGAAIGALIGGLAGAGVGAKLDADDQRKRQLAMHKASGNNIGAGAYWYSPEKETWGSVTRLGELFYVNGSQCMLVEETVTIRGDPVQVEDTMCQDPDGQWAVAAL